MNLEDKVELTKRITNGIYTQASVDRGYAIVDLKDKYWDSEITEAEFDKKKKLLDDLYLRYVLKLSTKILNMILEVHETGEVKRVPRTLDAITGELLEREIYEREAKETE